MINSLGMCCVFSVGFLYFLGMERRGRQEDANIFHHYFLFLSQHSFYKSPSSNKNTHASVFFKEKECIALSACSHLYVGRIQHKMYTPKSWQKGIVFSSYPSSYFSETYFIYQEGQIENTAMNSNFDLKLSNFFFYFKQNLNIQCQVS